ncbi:hypothetical protein [Vibrio cholerae]|uniref:hypothetical protein n=1 Tax=Vibrio cholerae TaxID=666 RepID=UPI000E0C93F0|nr:hypothetical protein [Vibrio cholerae]GIC20327.1 hypothetical protein VCSRO99_0780 [Vibrio cholerae]
MSRLEKLYRRRTEDTMFTKAQVVSEAYRNIQQSDSVKYVIGAMQPIDKEYTDNTYKQAERVKSQLESRLTEVCDFEYQGSVTNDTHIKAKSDIDLLVITRKFFTLETPQKPTYPYKGDPLADLLNLRREAEDVIESAFPQAFVDKEGSKSISVEGGSLTRKIDVVPSNWYNTNLYAESQEKMYRGVQILDKSVPERIANTPFLHNAWIDWKDSNTNGGFRRVCRLMKSLKYDADNINLSSYDIVSIAFNIRDEDLIYSKGQELLIMSSCLNYCRQLQSDSNLRESIKVPDGHRKIFCNGHATLKGLNQLTQELQNLENDILQENILSFRTLNEAKI